MYISVKTLKNIKNYAVMLRSVSHIFPMLMLYFDEPSGSYLQC